MAKDSGMSPKRKGVAKAVPFKISLVVVDPVHLSKMCCLKQILLLVKRAIKKFLQRKFADQATCMAWECKDKCSLSKGKFKICSSQSDNRVLV